MIIGMGIVAGDIWHYLDGNGESTLSELVKAVDESRDVVLMSLGWLAREGHVTLTREEDYKISLREKVYE
ncbi:MAG: hypothetical protein GY853_11745 [PVC group bacterium]|nr:hypothetical protein [PVC group bacterium]